jgi:predicted ester cyclase
MDTEGNKAAVRRYIEEVINNGKVELIDELFTPEQAERVKEFMSGGDDAFPDGREEIRDLVAEGNTVMARWNFRATHQGEFMGVPATGKEIEMIGFAVYYFNEAGLIEDDLMVMNWLSGLRQMGATVQLQEQT